MSDSPPPKKRGAPIGNANALKHGYYSPRFRPPTIPSPDYNALTAQIDLLLLYIHQVRLIAEEIETAEGKLGLYRVLAFAMSSLNHLLRAYQRICGTQMEKSNTTSSVAQTLYLIYLQYLSALTLNLPHPSRNPVQHLNNRIALHLRTTPIPYLSSPPNLNCSDLNDLPKQFPPPNATRKVSSSSPDLAPLPFFILHPSSFILSLLYFSP